MYYWLYSWSYINIIYYQVREMVSMKLKWFACRQVLSLLNPFMLIVISIQAVFLYRKKNSSTNREVYFKQINKSRALADLIPQTKHSEGKSKKKTIPLRIRRKIPPLVLLKKCTPAEPWQTRNRLHSPRQDCPGILSPRLHQTKVMNEVGLAFWYYTPW